MAEVKRELMWIQTTFFAGWGCNSCHWKDFLPRKIATLLAPAAEAQQAFKQHTCEKTLRSDHSHVDSARQSRRA
jgi:hypothetical protein